MAPINVETCYLQLFILDRRTHGSEELKTTGSEGPSLIAYNDGSFDERDWNALRNISDSSKRTDMKYTSFFLCRLTD
jgi:hypothetical protein